MALAPPVHAQTTHTVCSSGCDYSTPELALADTLNVTSGDTLNIFNDTYVLSSTLVVDRGLTLNFNDSVVDASSLRGVVVDGSSTFGIRESNLTDSGTSNFASGIPYGQTFRANSDFVLTQFQFKVRATSGFPTNLNIPGRVRAGGRTGSVIADANAFVTAGTAGSSLTITFTLDQPVSLTNGSTYGIEFVTLNGPYSILQAQNPYPTGNGYNNSDLTVDYAFSAIGGPPVTINDVTIRNGQAPASETGGAILVTGGAVLNLAGSTLDANFSDTGGGGLSNVDSFASIADGNLFNNSTDGEGGAVLTGGITARTSLARLTVDGNSASLRGGGIATRLGGRTDIVESVVSNNAAVDSSLQLDFLAEGFTGRTCGLGTDPIGQIFEAPTAVISAFSFRVRLTAADRSPTDLPVTGTLREDGPNGAILATANAIIPGGTTSVNAFTLLFTLDTPVPVTVGNDYAVEMPTPGVSPATYSLLDSSTPYDFGVSYTCGNLDQFPDRAFGIYGALGDGGGIFSGGEIDVVNSTVSSNIGDGAYADQDSRLSSVLSTFAFNSGAGVNSQTAIPEGIISLSGSLLSDNVAGDCGGIVDSFGYNLIGDVTGCAGSWVATTGDQTGGDGSPIIDPLLGPLQDNGGPTSTHALVLGSLAVDAGVNDPTCGFGTTPYTDQRAILRPQEAACDIGAFELIPSIQDAIDAAAPSATIIVPDGTYFEAITIGDGKVLQGSGPDNVIIDATGLNTPAVTGTGDFSMIGIRVTGADFAGQGAGIDIDLPFLNVVLDNVRVDGNSAGVVGGGIFVEFNSSLTLTNSEILGNSAGSNGGGIYLDGGTSQTVTINNVTIANNTADNDGGGIYAQASTLLIGAPACTTPRPPGQNTNFISNNTAVNGNGGGLWTQANLTLTYTQFSDNSAASGAGIHQESPGSLAMDCGFMNLNSAEPNTGLGGAINTVDGAVAINDTTFERNDAGGGGGAMNLAQGATITNSTFLTNDAFFGPGGAIRSPTGTLNSTDNTFRDNASNVNGGAIYARTLVSNTDVFEDNAAVSGGGAITLDAPGQMQIFDGLLQNNTVGDGGVSFSGRGGALEFLGILGLIEDTRFLNNTAPEAGDDASLGGAIYTDAVLELILADSTISGSNAGDGGAVFNAGTLSVARSALVSNSVTNDSSPLGPRGGAIASTGTLNVSNTTISSNVVNAGPASDGDGGAIASFAGGTANLNNVTLAFNTAPDGGALYAEPNEEPLTFSNTLFFGNAGTTADCDEVQSLGYNIYDVNPCPTQAATDVIGDALILALANNGGPTQTHELQPASPAREAGAVPVAFPQFDAGNLPAIRLNGALPDNSQILVAGPNNPTGSAYVDRPIDISQDFSVRFEYVIVPGLTGSADGITFSFTDDPDFLGDGGGS
ncbi:MAG: choice-of-anchor Q domain-containing protein, partial [Xanthomonadales bacterium]|nr:choice-of-anchor Q domain-containing protein [Xanthomonadales bacterium]